MTSKYFLISTEKPKRALWRVVVGPEFRIDTPLYPLDHASRMPGLILMVAST